eukprot:TRINITY_DN1636_c0_g1_i2.p1 TRINITY_DN1636_c0_g1~~TRINITY_DN1636_c0_g1_i2.p1  ORF type:complete len:383 (+),score=151.83 TRINITY_DN1636_c0_g1_i2:663-1811(+)
MRADAERRGLDHDMMAEDASFSVVHETSGKDYFSEFRKVTTEADVIIEVLDARDPLKTRLPDVLEKSILSRDPSKRIVLLLNKVDLVPREVVVQWLNYLRRDFPTIPFKSSTQKQRTKLDSQVLGADALLRLLKNYSRTKDMKKSILACVVGFPNVGKSSVINSLKRTKAAGVGATPGFTKKIQSFRLDKNVILMDSPGVVFVDNDDVILRNAMKIEQIDDPIPHVDTIVRRVDPGQLLRVYRIPEYDSVESFLMNLAKVRGFLRKGGVPDVFRAAKAVLIDWNSGVIPFYTLPPHVDEESLLMDKDMLQSVYKLDDLSLPGSGVPISRYCQFSSDGRMGGEDLADMFGEIGVEEEDKEGSMEEEEGDEMEEEDDEDEDEDI